MPSEYADLTLEELLDIQQQATKRFEAERDVYKSTLANLKPYLDAAWAEDTQRKASQSPPELDQHIGME